MTKQEREYYADVAKFVLPGTSYAVFNNSVWCDIAEAVRNAPAFVDPVEDLAKALSDEHDRVIFATGDTNVVAWADMNSEFREEYRAMARLAIARGAK